MDDSLKIELGKEAHRIEEDALFSGKAHYNAASPWEWWHRFFGVLSALGSGVAGVAVLKAWAPAVAVGAAAIGVVSSIVLTVLKPQEMADRHHRAGDRYFALKNRARVFRNIDLQLNTEADKASMGLKALSEEREAARTGAPRIPAKAHQKAKQGIEVEKFAEYQVDKPAASLGRTDE